MTYSINNLSPHKKQFQTPAMQVPAILHVSDDLMPNDATLAEIEGVASDPHAFHHVAAMSDVHSKKGRKNPTGTVMASEAHLLPQINDTAPNCGMRFLKTNLTDADLTPENIDRLFQELIGVIPTKTYVGTKVPYSLIIDICRKGIAPVREFFGSRTKNEIENAFEGGNFFSEIPTEKEILNAIPKLFLHIGQYRLGILGAAGNHFLDLMKITEIENQEIATKFGLQTGQYIFLLHTGSGLLGQYASYLYTPKRKEHLSQRIILEIGKFLFKTDYKKEFKALWKKIESFKDSKEYFAYDDQSLEGKLFLTSHNAAANQGYANRSILNHQLDLAIEKVLGKNPELDMLYDMPHVFVHREKNHFGKDVWIHRNGTVRANGPARMNHPLFSQTGEPVFIPSSMSTPAYICAGTDANESSFFSASHGTGRRKDPLADATHNKAELFDKLKQRQVKLFNAKSKGVVMQDSSYYKDVEEVIAGMEANQIVKAVAKMEPVAVLMY
ncbi:MAG: RtcB family protein [Candidatus Moranbacteria bacterium]|nr:RtcB family protein [Candidatus Moranbacteria bacterium]